jgi:hypothetical protein
MKIAEAVVVWVPETGNVRIERHGSDWDNDPDSFWALAADAWNTIAPSPPTKEHIEVLSMFILFNTLVVRDRVPVEAAHKAFLKIEEYRQAISPDTPGVNGEEV